MSMDLRRLLGMVTHHGGGPIVDSVPMRQPLAHMQPMQPMKMQPRMPNDAPAVPQWAIEEEAMVRAGLPNAPRGPVLNSGDAPAVPQWAIAQEAANRSQHLRGMLGVSGGSPQGFPGAESIYTSPNMQQPMPPQLQGPDDPGYTPLQGSRNVPNPQSSNKRRTPRITF